MYIRMYVQDHHYLPQQFLQPYVYILYSLAKSHYQHSKILFCCEKKMLQSCMPHLSKFNRRLNRVNFKAPPYFQFGAGIAILFSYVDIIQSMQ